MLSYGVRSRVLTRITNAKLCDRSLGNRIGIAAGPADPSTNTGGCNMHICTVYIYINRYSTSY